MNRSVNFVTILPILSLYIFAGYRLMPAVQQIYASFTSLTFVEPAVDMLSHDIKNLNKSNIDQNQNILSPNIKFL